MSGMLQIIGECAYVSQDTPIGRTKVLLYKGAVFSADVPEAKHLLSSGLVARVGGDAVPGLDATGEPVLDPDAAGTGKPAVEQVATDPDAKATGGGTKPDDDTEAKAAADAAAEVEAKREAARAKLPADGSAPHHNAGEDVWREFAVSKGYDRETVEKSSRDEIKKLFQS